MATKLFISHASEDKEDFIEPLVSELRRTGYEVWYDKDFLTLGDSLLQEINKGLVNSDFGIVVLSPNYLRKKWPLLELDGLSALESTNRKVILPILKDLKEEDVRNVLPNLAGRFWISSDRGISVIVQAITLAVEAAERRASFYSGDNALSMFQHLDAKIAGDKRVKELEESPDSIALAREAFETLRENLYGRLERFCKDSEILKFTLKIKDGVLIIDAAYGISVTVGYSNARFDSICSDKLWFFAYVRHDYQDTPLEGRIAEHKLTPSFNHQSSLIWKSDRDSQVFTTEQLTEFILESIMKIIAQAHEEGSKQGPPAPVRPVGVNRPMSWSGRGLGPGSVS